MKDYLRRGLVNWLLRHVMTFVGLFLISMVGRRSPIAAVCICTFKDGLSQADCGIQWRYLLFIGVFAMELYLIVAPSSPRSEAHGYTFVDQLTPEWMVLESIFPRRVVYQHILFLQQMFLFLSVAVSRVAPVLFAGMMQANEMEMGTARELGGRIGELTKRVESECKCVWHSVGSPLISDSMANAERGGARCEWTTTAGRDDDGDGSGGGGGYTGGGGTEEGWADEERMGQGSQEKRGSRTVHVFVSTRAASCGCLEEDARQKRILIGQQAAHRSYQGPCLDPCYPIWICGTRARIYLCLCKKYFS